MGTVREAREKEDLLFTAFCTFRMLYQVHLLPIQNTNKIIEEEEGHNERR